MGGPDWEDRNARIAEKRLLLGTQYGNRLGEMREVRRRRLIRQRSIIRKFTTTSSTAIRRRRLRRDMESLQDKSATSLNSNKTELMTNIQRAFRILETIQDVTEIEFQASTSTLHRIRLEAMTQLNFNFEDFKKLPVILEAAREEYKLIGEQLKWSDSEEPNPG